MINYIKTVYYRIMTVYYELQIYLTKQGLI